MVVGGGPGGHAADCRRGSCGGRVELRPRAGGLQANMPHRLVCQAGAALSSRLRRLATALARSAHSVGLDEGPYLRIYGEELHLSESPPPDVRKTAT